MKISKKNICFFFLMFSATAFYGTNYYFSKLYVNDFAVIMSFIVTCLVILSTKRFSIKSPYSISAVLSLIIWARGLFVASRYSLSVITLFKECCYTLTPIIVYFTYRTQIKSKKDAYLLIKHICVTAMICNILSLLAFCFSFRGIDLLNIDIFSKQRDGTVRFIIGEVMLVIGLFASIGNIANRKVPLKEKHFYVINILLTAINLIFVVKTRTLTLYILTTLFMLPVLSRKVKKSRKILFCFLAIVLLFIAIISEIIPYINDLFSNDYGIQMRFSEIEYYLTYFRDNWLFGVGYASSAPINAVGTLGTGPLGRYYTSDVGVIGLLFKEGLIGLAWLFSWFKTTISLLKKNVDGMLEHYEIMVKLIVLFLLMSCINLIITDDSRFAYIPLVMLIAESSCYVRG